MFVSDTSDNKRDSYPFCLLYEPLLLLLLLLLSGFYEDPSALFTGWKINPVNFDSVFNHTAFAYGLGSPDVVPMFSGHGSYRHQEYDADLEDFGLPDLSFLDTWVFDKLSELLDEADGTDTTGPLSSGPALLFLHLLGIDSNGHAGKDWRCQSGFSLPLNNFLNRMTVIGQNAEFTY
eukprot:scaffold9595_cov27-Prasinocladus_malaysianus.AAC.2